MSNSFLNRNLASLKKKHPALFEKINSAESSEFYAVTKSKSGPPALIHIDNEGRKKTNRWFIIFTVCEKSLAYELEQEADRVFSGEIEVREKALRMRRIGKQTAIKTA